jgi:hypothetical protein
MNDGLTQSYLLGAFALALVLTCRCGMHLALGAQRALGWAQWVFTAAAWVVTGILACDAIACVNALAGSALAPIPELLVYGLAIISLTVNSRAFSLRLPARELVARPVAWMVLLWSVAATGWSAGRFYETSQPPMAELGCEPRPELELERNATAFSDRGRPIPLYRMHSTVPGWPSGFQATTPALKRLRQSAICRGGPDASSNCHGWVFAGGEYLLDGCATQTILEDNGYEPCSDPRAGDVIVYWSGRFIAHTGLVSGVLADGTVLIESKWNLHERFLHRPEDQPYSGKFTFYRTSRGGHRVSIRQ